MAETDSTQSSYEPYVAPATTSVEEDVRLKYFEVRRDEQTHEAMRAARLVAEAVCAGLADDVPEEKRNNYQKKKDGQPQGLGARIEVLEQLSADGLLIPRAVVAGLRTLQAYGNYAAHYNKGDGRQPPPPATKSAMASLALVVQWFLGRKALADKERAGVPIRDRSPRVPRILERWKIHRRTKLSTPEFKLEGDVSADSVLGAVYTYYAQSVSICERICREVISRETELDGSLCEADELPLLIDQVAEALPIRVPRSVAADIGELWRRRAVVLRAMKDRDDDVEHFLVEVKLRNLAQDVRRWFDGDYLSRSKAERFWLKYIIIVGCTWMFVGECRSDWNKEGRDEVQRELVDRYCVEPAAKTSPICTDLAHDLASKK